MDPTDLPPVSAAPAGAGLPPAPGALPAPSIPGLAAAPALPAPGTAPAPPPPPTYDQSYLALTPDQETRFADYLHQRITECRKAMGLEYNATPGVSFGHYGSRWSSGILSETDSWAYKREINQRCYDGDFEWRKAVHPKDAIFHTSNYSLNPAKGWARKTWSKLDGVQLSTDPFFAAMPQRNASDDLARAAEMYLQDVIGASNLRETMQEARRAALIRNDAVVKISWKKRVMPFVGPARVMVAPPMSPAGQLPDGTLLMVTGQQMADGNIVPPGEPIRVKDGDCIYENDTTLTLSDGSDGSPVQQVLEKDPTFTMPAPGTAIYQDFPSLPQVTIEEGLDSATVGFKDFIFPLECRSLQEADVMVHVFDSTLNDMRRRYGGFDTFEAYASSYPISDTHRSRPEQGEIPTPSVRKSIGEHEFYILADPDETGEDKWIFGSFDYQQKKFIFRDYMLNHMDRSPFVMIPGVEKIENRAYGSGVYEMSKDKLEYADAMLNRVAVMASKAGKALFKRKGAIVEEKEGGLEFVFGDPHIYEVDDTSSATNPPVFEVTSGDVPEIANELRSEVLQAAQLEFGQLTPGDGAEGNLDPSKTATGNAILQQTGNSLQDEIADLHARRFEEMLEIALEIALENMPPQVPLMMNDGQDLMMLNREEIRALPKDIRLLLSKARSAESLARAQQAADIVEKYTTKSKALQKEVRSFYIQQLRDLDVPDADEKLKEPTAADIAAEAQAAGQGQEKPPTATVAAKLGDFVGSERPQIVQKFFEITPASPQEVQQAAVANVQSQQTPLPAHHPHVLPAPQASAAA